MKDFFVFQPIRPMVPAGALPWYEMLYRPGGCSPVDAIHQADAAGRLVDFELDLVDRALREAAPHQFRIGLNISTPTLNSAQLVPRLGASIRKHNVIPDHIVLEITEHGKQRITPGGLSAVNHLRSQGIAFAIDDLGIAGQAAELMTARLVTIIKLDKDIIRSGGAVPHVWRLSVSALNRLTGCVVVAEGIESYRDFTLAQNLGATHFQGYYDNGEPVPMTLANDDPALPRADVARACGLEMAENRGTGKAG